MAQYMKANDLDATRIESYMTAFRELSNQGKLELVEPQSADQFYEEHPELHDNRIPPLIAARTADVRATSEQLKQAAAATQRGSVVNIVDYGKQTHGMPPEPEIYSFKRKIRDMSASEIRRAVLMIQGYARS